MGCQRANAALAALLMIAGCAGNGNGLDANGRPLTGSSGSDSPLTADFDSIQQHIFTPICSVCHVGGSAPQGLRLDAANSYALTVGVPSTEVPSLDRIKAGDPDDSYLIQKLEGHAAVGAQMPFGGPYLSTDTIAVIRQWITNGAPPSTAAAATAAAAAFSLAGMAPAADELQTEAVRHVMLNFNHELDATRLDSSTIRLDRLESESSAPIAVHIDFSRLTPQRILIWPATPLPAGRYRLRVEPGAVADLSGASLGELQNIFDVEPAR